ncbi:Ser/Thr protein kinase [Mycolicibacterium flavescens]|uniref:hypothetical protein n=1 Tax=Mycobacterium neumannii TaxID=2048551 RepID=UPI000B93E7BA|nr:hypothetical protein [Mycobacterium neumannii]VEG38600.1 Ser/Thr protein kinase [Mycolicibacterium flavescens]
MLDSWADRTAGVEELVAECLSSPETTPPFLVSVAANVAAFVVLWRFDFDAARGWQQWAAPYQNDDNPFSRIYGPCLAGMAAREQLDDGAERCFREALQLAESYGGIRHSDAALLAGGLLGELLFERGDIDEAGPLLDECYEFGSSGGTVEFLILRHVVSARVRAARGDLETAAVRLNEGVSVATTLGLPRLRAHVHNELARLGLPIVDPPGRADHGGALPDGGWVRPPPKFATKPSSERCWSFNQISPVSRLRSGWNGWRRKDVRALCVRPEPCWQRRWPRRTEPKSRFSQLTTQPEPPTTALQRNCNTGSRRWLCHLITAFAGESADEQVID